MEADLSQYHGRSLADYESGELTLWQVYARLKYLPLDSATARAQGSDGWTLTHYLLADLVHVMGGQAHPADPRVPKREAADLEHKRRTAQRHQRLNRPGSVFRRAAAKKAAA